MKKKESTTNNRLVDLAIRDEIESGASTQDIEKSITDAVINGDLLDARALELSKLNRSSEEKAINREAREMRSLIGEANDEFSFMSFVTVDPQEAAREVVAEVEYRERARGLPIEERLELRDKIVSRASVAGLDPGSAAEKFNHLIVPQGLNATRRQIFQDPQILTKGYIALEKEFTQGNLTRREVARRARNYVKWANTAGISLASQPTSGR